MFYQGSKLLWMFFAPSHILIWLTFATAVAIFFRNRRPAQILGVTSASLFILIGLFPLYTFALQPIENMVKRPAWPARVDGIVTLGGGLNVAVLRSRGVVVQNQIESRLVGAFEVARRYPNARVVFAGGSAGGNEALADAISARHVFAQLGLDPTRVIYDNKSRNTRENLVNAQRLVKPKKGEVWLLATSASQLPRALAVAEDLHWKMMPWPTDYTTPEEGVGRLPDVPINLELTDMAAREWLGIMYYRLAGAGK